LSEAISGYVAWLANQEKNLFALRQRELRKCAIGTHARTPENIAAIQLGVETALRFAVEVGALTAFEAENHKDQSWKALLTLAAAQDHLLKSESPAQRFLALLSTVLSSKQGHVEHTSGYAPEPLAAFGWEVVARDNDGCAIVCGQGRRIGWVKDEHLYLDPEAAFSEVQKLASSQHAAIPLSQNTLWKRLEEAGKIAIRDNEHIQTKVRTAEGRKRVICLRLADVVEFPEGEPDGSQQIEPEADRSQLLQDDLPF